MIDFGYLDVVYEVEVVVCESGVDCDIVCWFVDFV